MVMHVSHVKDKKMKVLRFTASWCQPCKMLEKTLEDIETQIPIEVIDIDENQGLAMDYGIRGVPTLVMLDGDIEVKRVSGMLMKNQLTEWLGA
jgi:thioredoxin 1